MSTFTYSTAVPPKTISLMKHFIGLDYKKPEKDGRYEAYRNYFAGKENNSDWEFLEKHQLIEQVGNDLYRLSVSGIYCLQAYLDIKISFRDKEDRPKGWVEVEG